MIQTTQLHYAYPGTQTHLEFPDVEIKQGEVAVIRGPSGSGKSTWLALVAALVSPTAGQLVVADRDLSTLGKADADTWRATTIGFLPQKLHLTPALSVMDNLRMAQWAAGVPEDILRIAEVLESLGIGELAKRHPLSLSGGQAQRAALARAVLMRPRILLADEPTASLDDVAAETSLTVLLQTAWANGASLVIATHDRRVSEKLAHEKTSADWVDIDLVQTATTKEAA